MRARAIVLETLADQAVIGTGMGADLIRPSRCRPPTPQRGTAEEDRYDKR